MRLGLILICFGSVLFLLSSQGLETEKWKTKYVASELINMWSEDNDRNFEEIMKIYFDEEKVFEEVKKNQSIFKGRFEEIKEWYKEKKCEIKNLGKY